MKILGLSCYYHDAAACLVDNGNIIAAAEEERFTRKKHDNAFPYKAIDYCLQEGNCKPEDIDYVYFYEKPFLKFERLIKTSLITGKFDTLFPTLPKYMGERLFVPDILKNMGFKSKVYFLEHHLSHAASSFFCSPFSEAAIVTLDGVGEWATTTIGSGKDKSIEILQEIQYPQSLGLFYAAITAFLGFRVNEDEYKVMGMASYGKPTYMDKMNELIKLNEDGSYELNMEYFQFHTSSESMFTPKLSELLGEPRIPNGPIDKRHEDIAASVQHCLEMALDNILKKAYELTKQENLCLAGGIALNGVANFKCFKKSPFKKIFIQPAAGDSGGALGAAMYGYLTRSSEPRKIIKRHGSLLGPQFSNDRIKESLIKNKADFEEMETNELIKKGAALLAEGKVGGLFQGRMEFGPRALGCRSILADPRKAEMKDILNAKVKFREGFRPFAPAVLEEKTQEYFDIDFEAPYMLLVPEVLESKRDVIAAVTHVDGTARPQTVRREDNPFYYDIINEFGKLTGVYVLVNTSYNLSGEPIVCTPEDAYRTFMNSEIDFLICGNFFVKKRF